MTYGTTQTFEALGPPLRRKPPTFNPLTSALLSLPDSERTDTIIIHFAERPNLQPLSSCPRPSYTYELNKAGFAGKEVWVIPEYDANLNLTQRIAWLRENFEEIPVVIDVFEGGYNPTPNVELSIGDLEQIMAVANVTAIRFPEVLSWYMNINYTTPMPVPDAWIHGLFDFAISHDLKVYWSDWKLGSDVEALTNKILAGYEDKITYLYQTNNQYQIPLVGYSYAHEFQHWGASVQSWYVDQQNTTRWDLNVDSVAEYLKLARNMGAQTIELEPYFYFFSYSEPLGPMEIMWQII